MRFVRWVLRDLAADAMRALRALGYLWSLPYGLVGLLALGVFLALGWVENVRWKAGAFEVLARGPFADWMGREQVRREPAGVRLFHWAAFTVGWTILLWRPPVSASTLPHEHRHVDQALVLGIFMPLVWGVSVLAQGYRRSLLERDARRAAGEPD
jgi:hypothetical protein